MKDNRTHLILCIVTLSITFIGQAAAQIPDLWNRDYSLVPSHSGKCLDLTNSATTDRTPIQQYQCSSGNPLNQRWFLWYDNSNGYVIQSKQPRAAGGTVEVTVDPTNASSNTAGIFAYNPSSVSPLSLRRWDLKFVADGRAQIVNRYSGKCLDVAGASQSNTAAIQQYTCNGSDQQLFWLYPTYGYMRLTSYSSGKCVDVYNALTTNQAPIQQWDCSTASQQQFTVLRSFGDNFRFIARHSGKCLDVTNASTSDGALFQQYQCGDNNPEQQIFGLSPAGTTSNGKQLYKIVRYYNSGTGQKLMDVRDNSLSNGALIQQYSAQSPGNNQKWIIE